MTYGDGVCDVNLSELLKFHKSHGKVATVTSVKPSARFGGMKINNGKVLDFKEKPQANEGSINGGYFVFNPEIFKYLNSDISVLEKEPMERLVEDGQLMAFNHNGFWHCMDTIRDKQNLNNLINDGNTPWL